MLVGFVAALIALVVPTIAQGATGPAKLDAFLYVDTVNVHPAGGVRRRVRSGARSRTPSSGASRWCSGSGTVAETGDILSTENIDEGYVTFPGMGNQKLNWGAHGATSNRVWFWTAAVNLPADYPLGAGTARVVFKTDEGKTGTYDYQFTIVPALKATAKAASKAKAKVKLAGKSAKS